MADYGKVKGCVSVPIRSARTPPARTRARAAMASCWRASMTAATWTSVRTTTSGVRMSASTPSATPTAPVTPATRSHTTTRRVKVFLSKCICVYFSLSVFFSKVIYCGMLFYLYYCVFVDDRAWLVL